MEPQPVRIGQAIPSCRTSIAGLWSNANAKVESAAMYYTRMSRPVLPNQELTKGGSAIALDCQQRARARWLQYVACWWRLHE